MLRLAVCALLLLALPYGGAARLPWSERRLQNTAGLQEAPRVDVSVRDASTNVTCARLSAAISVLVQYPTQGIQDGVVQVAVPGVNSVAAAGSCGPDAFIQLSWAADAAPSQASSLALVVDEETEPELLAAPDDGGNSLRFSFQRLNGTFALAAITGVVNVTGAPPDYPANTTVEVQLVDEPLIEAPLGAVYICYERTVYAQDADDNLTAVGVMLGDLQLLAYYEGDLWPAQATYCRPSEAAAEPDNTMAIVVGTSAGVVGVGLVGAFIYYLRTR